MKARDVRLYVLPDPHGHDLGGGVFQPFDLVEEIMIKPGDDRVDGAFELGEVDHPARGRVDFSADGDLAAKRVTVNAATFVSIRYIGQPVGCLEPEIFDELDGHFRQFSVSDKLRNIFCSKAVNHG